MKRGAPKDGIPAIWRTEFANDWSGLTIEYYDPRYGERVNSSPRLKPDDEVIGVTRKGDARAYPLRLLNWHEVVNDDFHGPLLVTYCPLCATGLTAVRRVNGKETVFGVSGLLYKSNLVMYDRLTESLWSQVLGQAIHGSKTGATLELVPSSVTTWSEWREDHPDTKVLLPPPKSSTVRGPGKTRNYEINPYTPYESSDRVGISDREYDDRLHPKTMVVGVTHDGVSKAYPLPAVRAAGGVVNDDVAGLPVVAAATESDSLFAYVREFDGQTFSFDPGVGATMESNATTWDVTTGTATSGAYTGAQLPAANDVPPMFWFSWADFHPESDIYGGARARTPSE